MQNNQYFDKAETENNTSNEIIEWLKSVHPQHLIEYDISSLTQQGYRMLIEILQIRAKYLNPDERRTKMAMLLEMLDLQLQYKTLDSEELVTVGKLGWALKKLWEQQLKECIDSENEFSFTQKYTSETQICEN